MLGAEVVDDEAVAADERLDRRPLARIPQEQGGEIEAGGPALRTLVQLVCVVLRESRACGIEQRACLGIAQRELLARDLQQLPAGPSSRQAGTALRAAREDELRAGLDVLPEQLERVQAVGVRQLVDVVQHEHDGLGQGSERSSQLRHRRAPHRPAGAGSSPERRRADRVNAVERRRDVREQRSGIVVPAFERHPGEGSRVLVRPLREQRRLPVAGRGGDADDVSVRGRAQLPDEIRSPDRALAERRDGELRREQVERDVLSGVAHTSGRYIQNEGTRRGSRQLRPMRCCESGGRS